MMCKGNCNQGRHCTCHKVDRGDLSKPVMLVCAATTVFWCVFLAVMLDKIL